MASIHPSRRAGSWLLSTGLVVLLAACNGGGPEGIGTSPPDSFPPSLAEPAAGSSAAAYESDEYFASGGLDQISAAEGYAEINSVRIAGLPGGEGQRIAIIDTGIDTDHPDLGRNLAEAYEFRALGDIPGPGLHGSHVAGIAAADRNGFGMHGVAYNGSIVSINAATQRTLFNQPSFAPVVVAASVGSAAGVDEDYCSDASACLGNDQRSTNPAASSDVMNLSLGSDSATGSDVILEAMRDAAAQQRAMVLAAGNSSLSQPSYPARFATDSQVQGFALVVVSGTRSGNTVTLSGFTNDCGSAAAYCLVAPGDNIYSTIPEGDYATASGTSMAAPHVAGALAVVRAAFPGISTQAAIQRLLDNADPISGCSASVCGQGFLNLAAALTGSGTLSVPTGTVVGGGSAPLGDTSLVVSGAFGDAFASAALDDILVLDAQGFPFLAETDEHIVLVDQPAVMLSMLQRAAGGQSEQASLAGEGWQATIAATEAAPDRSWYQPSLLLTDGGGRQLIGMRLSLAISDATSLALYADHVSDQAMGVASTVNRDGAVPASMAMGLDAWAGTGEPGVGTSLSHQLGEGTTLRLGAFRSDVMPGSDTTPPYLADEGDQAQSWSVHARLDQAVGQESTVTFGLSQRHESGSVLGETASGALAPDSTVTSTVDVGARLSITQQLDLIGSGTVGQMALRAGAGSLYGDDATATVTGFSIGAAIDRPFGDGDQLFIGLSQPLRAEDGSAMLSIPVARTESGAIIYRPSSVDLEPSGRELMLHGSYRTPVSEQSTVELLGYIRQQANNIADAETDIGAGISFTTDF